MLFNILLLKKFMFIWYPNIELNSNLKVFSDFVEITFHADSSQNYSWGEYYVPSGYCFLNAVFADATSINGQYFGICTQRFNANTRRVLICLNWKYSGNWAVLITLAKEVR